MSDIIKLLPDAIANQIAAGEVIQRPASVVKELLENSVDAGARHIQLIVRDSGKALIQVVDDGRGMSAADVRMSIERHATSKIANSEDLFRIKTMGFRGEAMASIAAVAQLDIKSMPQSGGAETANTTQVGTHLIVEGSRVVSQEVCACQSGTTISVKNLFFNVPARRKFLKSDAVEMRHIIDEFERVALVNPEVSFRFHHNDQQLFFLQPSNIRQRVTAILGKSYNEKLVPVEEHTDLAYLHGFVGKPEAARKSRGEQFLFVNGRYFKSSYFHTAIQQAFESLIPSGYHPSYFIYFEVDPSTIDVNIHPTKTEIKFEEERAIFAILRSAVKRSLGQYHVAPSLDFERDPVMDIPPPPKGTVVPRPGVMVNTSYNPFTDGGPAEARNQQQQWERGAGFQKQSSAGWESLYEGLNRDLEASGDQAETTEELFALSGSDDHYVVRQIGYRYILIQSEEGVFLLHQHRAHMRVLFEEFEQRLQSGHGASQQELFPYTLELSPQDVPFFESATETLKSMGFDIDALGPSSYAVRGIPTSCDGINIEETIGGFLDDMRADRPEEPKAIRERVLRSMAQQSAIKSGKELKAQEMIGLFRQLMRCRQPRMDLQGKPTFVLLDPNTLEKMFQ